MFLQAVSIKAMELLIVFDALPSSGLNPLEGSTM